MRCCLCARVRFAHFKGFIPHCALRVCVSVFRFVHIHTNWNWNFIHRFCSDLLGANACLASYSSFEMKSILERCQNQTAESARSKTSFYRLSAQLTDKNAVPNTWFVWHFHVEKHRNCATVVQPIDTRCSISILKTNLVLNGWNKESALKCQIAHTRIFDSIFLS